MVTGPAVRPRDHPPARRKWDLGHSLHDVLDRVREPGPRAGRAQRAGPIAVLDRLDRECASAGPRVDRRARGLWWRCSTSTASIASRSSSISGSARGIGFYTQMIFELTVATPERPGRGLRRRPLRRTGPRAGQRPRRPRRRVRVRAGTAARRLDGASGPSRARPARLARLSRHRPEAGEMPRPRPSSWQPSSASGPRADRRFRPGVQRRDRSGPRAWPGHVA